MIEINPITRHVSLKHVDWTTVELDEFIQYDLETTPLFIKTDSLVGSNEKVRVFLYTDQEVYIGGFNLYFRSRIEYFIHHCVNSTNFPADLPSADERVWKITLTRNSDSVIRLVIHCNGVEVLNMLISQETCVKFSSWNTNWIGNVKKISFHKDDTASDFYSGYRSLSLRGKFYTCLNERQT